jgi:NADH-quinone oxidoreductase subunit D
MIGVPIDEKRIAYVPAVNLEQLVAYANQRKTVVAFRRYPIHGYVPQQR